MSQTLQHIHSFDVTTHTSFDVTCVPLRAAVYVVAATYSILKRAATVRSRWHFTAGTSIRTLILFIGAYDATSCPDVRNYLHRCIHFWRSYTAASVGTGSSRHVASISIWTAVFSIAATNSIWKRTTAIFT